MTASAPEDSRDFHDPLVLQLTEKLTDCAVRLRTVEQELQAANEALGKPTKAWFEAARTAEARVQELDAALRSALVCKGSYQGTTETDGGYPAICSACADAARAALSTEDNG